MRRNTTEGCCVGGEGGGARGEDHREGGGARGEAGHKIRRKAKKGAGEVHE